jgi:integrase/recombinase XerD
MGRRGTMKLPRFVQGFVDPKSGNTYHYLRRPGFKLVRLPGVPWSPTFMEAYEAALSAGSPTPIGAKRVAAGSVSDAVARYLVSKAFTEGLAPSSQQMRRAILERFREKHGDKRIATLLSNQLEEMLGKLAPFAQRNWRKTLRGLMQFARKEKLIQVDPTETIKLEKAPKSPGHMTWGEEQIAVYREYHKLGTMARVAIELLLNIAARRGDAYQLGRQHLHKGRLEWRPNKTRRTTGKSLSVPVMKEFQVAIDSMPAKRETLTFLTTDYGRSFASAAAFGNKFADWCKDAGLGTVQCDDGRTRSYRAHGLRKAACRRLAEAGCTAPEIMAVSGHSTLAQVQIYIEEADRKRMAEAAMQKVAKAVAPKLARKGRKRT